VLLSSVNVGTVYSDGLSHRVALTGGWIMAKVLLLTGGAAKSLDVLSPNNSDCQRIIRHFFSESKPVAQLCHAPLALAAAGVLGGRRAAAYPAIAPDVRAAGADLRAHAELEQEKPVSTAR
jgi:putative intracellular protease/amidase